MGQAAMYNPLLSGKTAVIIGKPTSALFINETEQVCELITGFFNLNIFPVTKPIAIDNPNIKNISITNGHIFISSVLVPPFATPVKIRNGNAIFIINF